MRDIIYPADKYNKSKIYDNLYKKQILDKLLNKNISINDKLNIIDKNNILNQNNYVYNIENGNLYKNWNIDIMNLSE
jgi:hypothetical protein